MAQSQTLATLTFTMSSQFYAMATTGGAGNGIYAYLYNTSPPGDADIVSGMPTANWTPLIIDGSSQATLTPGDDGAYTATVTLTDQAHQTASGAIYLILQSANSAHYLSLTNSASSGYIGSESDILSQLLATNQYGYAQFEYTLNGVGGDAGDLTAIPGFALNTQISVTYSDNTTQYRGYELSQSGGPHDPNMGAALTNAVKDYIASGKDPQLTYPSGGLAGQNMMFVGAGTVQLGAADIYPVSYWSNYLGLVGQQYNLTLNNAYQGGTDANALYHNAVFYSYEIQETELDTGSWGSAGDYFVFSPTADSQTKAWMVISESDLQSNLYAAGAGRLYIYSDPYLTQPFVVPGSGPVGGGEGQDNTFVVPSSTNDEFGNVTTQWFTGFTAGYLTTLAEQGNPYNATSYYGPSNLAAQILDLNTSTDWDTYYAFDNKRLNASIVDGILHNDPYAQTFFEHSNVYGAPFSDNLSININPGPLISLSQPGANGTTNPANDVTNINFNVYGPNEPSPSTYTPPVGGPYLPLNSGQHDYLIPDEVAGSLTLTVVGGDNSIVVRKDATVQFGIYTGNGTFEYVTLPSVGDNIWRNYSFSKGADGFEATVSGSNVVGTFLVQNIPVSSQANLGDVGWYQLVISDEAGDRKIYEFYTTSASTPGTIQTQLEKVAASGGADINRHTLTGSAIELDLNEYSTMPTGLLEKRWWTGLDLTNPGVTPNYYVAAPVAGTLADTTFTASPGQTSTGLPTQNTPGGFTVGDGTTPEISLTTATPLAFAWTGANNAAGTFPTFSGVNLTAPGLLSAYTNQIMPGHVAQIAITQTGGGTFTGILQAVADLDGRWQTTSSITLGNGTFTATVQEFLSDGATVFSGAPLSAPLTINVTGVSGPGAVNATAAEISADLDNYGANLPTSITISDSEALTVTVGQITGDAGALAVAQNADTSAYKLIVQDKAGNIAPALSALSSNTHLQQIEFTDVGPSVLEILYTDYTANAAAIDKMTGAHSFLMSVTGQAYSSMSYDYNDDNELTGAQYFNTGMTDQAYTGYEVAYDGSNRLLNYTFTGVSGQAYHAYEYDYAAGYASVLPNNGLIGQKYFFANVQGQAYTNYEHDLDENGLTTRIYYSGVKTQLYSSYEDDYIVNSTGSHFAGQKYYFTDIVGRKYTGLEKDLDTSGNVIKEIFTGGQTSATQVYSSWENEYASGVLTGQKYYQTDITGQDYTGYVVELNASGQKIGETWTGVTGQAYSAFEYEYANGDGVVTGISRYFTNVQNTEYASYQLDYDVTYPAHVETQIESQAIYNHNDGSHTIKGLLSTAQTLNSIFNDTMTGGQGADTFSFTPFFGQATIIDFTPDHADPTKGDQIRLPTSEFADFAYVNDQAHKKVVDGHTVITGSNGDTITLQGYTADLKSSDFLFA
jgi:hypothetical protein